MFVCFFVHALISSVLLEKLWISQNPSLAVTNSDRFISLLISCTRDYPKLPPPLFWATFILTAHLSFSTTACRFHKEKQKIHAGRFSVFAPKSHCQSLPLNVTNPKSWSRVVFMCSLPYVSVISGNKSYHKLDDRVDFGEFSFFVLIYAFFAKWNLKAWECVGKFLAPRQKRVRNEFFCTTRARLGLVVGFPMFWHKIFSLPLKEGTSVSKSKPNVLKYTKIWRNLEAWFNNQNEKSK